MTVDLKTFLIACPLVFLGGFIDSIAGGGGLITMPAYLLAGLPPHLALGTNKLSSMMGTSASVYRVVKNRMLKPRLAVPGIIAALLGSTLGSRLVLLVSDEILKYVMVVVLPFVAIIVLNKKIFKDIGADEEIISVKTLILVTIISFVIGTYDGFYGPGTGTFLLVGYMLIAKLPTATSYGQMKIVNFSSNLAAFITFISTGNMVILLGLAAGVCSILGNYLGSGLAIKNGIKIVRPVIVIVLVLLILKIIFGW